MLLNEEYTVTAFAPSDESVDSASNAVNMIDGFLGAMILITLAAILIAGSGPQSEILGTSVVTILMLASNEIWI